MPVPKRKISRARKSKRAANKNITPASVTICQTCKAPVLPHQVCTVCGHYKGVKVLRTKADRLHKRNQERQAIKEKMEASKSAAAPVEKITKEKSSK